MGSRRQTWRKTQSYTGETIFNFCDKGGAEITNEGVDKFTAPKTIGDDSVVLDNHRSGTGAGAGKKLRSALSTGDLSKSLRQSTGIKFSQQVHVCLIPTREDLSSVSQDVFWNAEDYQIFKREAVDELRTYLQLKGITAKEAIQALYQPQPEEFSFLRSLHVNNDTAENGLSRSDSSPAVMEMASSSNMADTSSTSSSHLHMNADANACEDDSMELSVSDDLNSGDVNESNIVDPNNNNKSSNNNTISQSNDIKLGFKTDLDMNKELGTIKTPARQGGA